MADAMREATAKSRSSAAVKRGKGIDKSKVGSKDNAGGGMIAKAKAEAATAASSSSADTDESPSGVEATAPAPAPTPAPAPEPEPELPSGEVMVRYNHCLALQDRTRSCRRGVGSTPFAPKFKEKLTTDSRTCAR